MELHTIGIDLGKTVFHLVGVPSNQAGVSEATVGVNEASCVFCRA